MILLVHARDRERQFVGGNTAAIVANAIRRIPPSSRSISMRRAPASSAFSTVPLTRCRTLDDFAGGDLVDQGIGELADCGGNARQRVDDSRPLSSNGACLVGLVSGFARRGHAVARRAGKRWIRGCRRRRRAAVRVHRGLGPCRVHRAGRLLPGEIGIDAVEDRARQLGLVARIVEAAFSSRDWC